MESLITVTRADDGHSVDIDFEIIGADLDDPKVVAELVQAVKQAQEELEGDETDDE